MGCTTLHIPRVLAVEDDPDDQLLLREAWDVLGLATRLEIVADGIALVERATTHRAVPHLVLLDLNTPRKSGLEVLRELPGTPYASVPVVVLTSSTDPLQVDRAYRHGAAGFVVKPASFQELVEVLRVVHDYWVRVVVNPAKPNPGIRR